MGVDLPIAGSVDVEERPRGGLDELVPDELQDLGHGDLRSRHSEPIRPPSTGRLTPVMNPARRAGQESDGGGDFPRFAEAARRDLAEHLPR
jgi:hypothetical protein